MNATVLVAPSAMAESPPAGGRDPILTALERSDLYRNYRHAFEHASGLPLELKRADSFHFPLEHSSRKNRFCALMARRNRSCAACLQFQQRLHDHAADEAGTTLECVAALHESAIPVRAGESLVAHLRTGQIFIGSPSRARFLEALRLSGLEENDPGAQELEAAYFETRVMTSSQYEAVVTLLTIFARHLGMLANRLLIERSHAELPVIAKARVFMEKNLSEQIRLEDVAHAANLSAFYFCKLFRCTTGLTFTKYLSRLRVEAAKQQLLNPDARICETAYSVGFQSLSQFNRVFRSVAGETPTAYRSRTRSKTPFDKRLQKSRKDPSASDGK